MGRRRHCLRLPIEIFRIGSYNQPEMSKAVISGCWQRQLSELKWMYRLFGWIAQNMLRYMAEL